MKLSPAIKALQKEGFLAELTPKMLKEIVKDSYECTIGEVEEEQELSEVVLAVLENYYAGDREQQGFKDGFMHHDWRFGQETDDVVAEFSMMLGSPPLFIQTGMGDNVIYAQRNDGLEVKIELSGSGLEAVADFFNLTLKERGDERHIYSLDTQGDYHAYLCLTKAQLSRLRKTSALAGFSRPSKKPPDPAKILQGLLKQEPSTCAWYLQRGTQLEALKEIDLAISDYQKGVAWPQPPADWGEKLYLLKAYKALTRLLFSKERFSECVSACGEAIDLATDKDSIFMVGREVRVLRGRALTELKQLKSAIADFDHLIADNQYDAEAFFYRAQAYEQLADRSKTEADRKTAQELGFRPR